MSQIYDDVSGYIVSDYEGLSSTFSEITELPSAGFCRLFKDIFGK